MIPVTPAEEPDDFDRKVRVPGNTFLATTPNPSPTQWKTNRYWSKALPDLHSSYKETCAYSASWTIRASATTTLNDGTVDHYIAKSSDTSQAYEWRNFRLCRSRMNSRKDVHTDVLDPFTLPPRWSRINFRTFLLVPDPELPDASRAQITATIDRFQLNDDTDYVNERINAIKAYCLGNMTLAQVTQRDPFIAQEMTAQNFDATFLPRMKAYFSAIS